MNKQLQIIQKQLIETYDGDPWYGRSLMSILTKVTSLKAWNAHVNNNHNNTVLLNHMINWRKFTISRFKEDANRHTHEFDKNNWLTFLNPSEKEWLTAMQELALTQQDLLQLLADNTDEILDKQVTDRDYNFGVLLNGMIQHDIYHIGQIMLTIK